MRKFHNFFSATVKNNFNSFKKILPLLVFLVGVMPKYSWANVSITAPSLTVYPSCGGNFPTSPFTLGNIVISENSANDISQFGTLILNAPTNFKFTSAGKGTFTSGGNVTKVNTSFTDDSTITITITGNNLPNFLFDTITLSDIKVKGLNSPTSVSNVITSGGSSIIAGINNTTIFATLTSVNAPKPTAPNKTDGARCGAGTVNLIATPVSGEAIDWYAAQSGGTVLLSNNQSFTTPSIGSTRTYYAEARNTSTGCVSAIRTAVIATVNAIPSAPNKTDGARCGAGTVNLMATMVSGEAIDWYDAQTGGTVLLSNNQNFTTPIISSTTTYYAEARNTTTGCISATRTAVTATVNALPSEPIKTDGARCGSGTVNLKANPQGSNETINWYAASSGGAALLSNSTNFTTPNITSTTTYFAEARNTTTGCVSATRTAVIATVNTLPSTPIKTDVARCGAGTVNLIATPVSGEAIDWYAAQSGGPVLLSNNQSFTTPIISSTTTYYAEARNTTTGCVSATRTAVTATVNIIPQGRLTANGPICPSGTGKLTWTSTSGVGPFTVVYNDGTANDTLTGVVSGNAFNVSTNPATTTTYTLVSVTDSNGCERNSGFTTPAATIIVALQGPSFTIQPISKMVCKGASVTLTAGAVGGTGSYSYQWFYNTSNSNTTGTPISGASGIGVNSTGTASYTLAINNTDTTSPAGTGVPGTFYYYCVFTNSDSELGCTTVFSNVASVTVVADPAVTIQPTISQKVCKGASVTLTAGAVGGTGSYNYQWFYNTRNSNTGGTAIAGASGSGVDSAGTVNYTLITNNINTTSPAGTGVPGSFYYYCVFTNSNAALGCNTIASSAASVTVVADPAVTIQPTLSQQVCRGASVTLTAGAVGGTGSYNYQWFYNTRNSNTGGTAIAGASGSGVDSAGTVNYTLATSNTDTTSPAGTGVPGTFYYYCVFTNSDSQLGCNMVASSVASVTVVSDPAVTIQPTISQEVCKGTVVTLISGNVGGTGSYNYQWFYNTSNSNSGGTEIISARGTVNSTVTASYTLATSNTDTTSPAGTGVPGTFYYYCVFNNSNAQLGCATVTSDVATVKVDSISVGGSVGVQQTICYNSTANPLSLSGYTGNILRWQFSTDGGVNWRDTTNTLPIYSPGNLTDTTQFRAVVKSGVCPAAFSAPVTITVRPVPVVTKSPDKTVCQYTTLFQTPPQPVIFTNKAPLTVTVTYNINGGADSLINVPGNGTTTKFVTTNIADTFRYNLKRVKYLSTPFCERVTTGTTTITVMPVPDIPSTNNPLSNKIICQNTKYQNFAAISPSDVVFRWIATNSNAEIVATGGNNNANAIISFGNADATIRIIDSSKTNGCRNSKDTTFKISNTPQYNPEVIHNGIDFICLYNKVKSYKWGWDDNNFKEQDYPIGNDTSGGKALYVTAQNLYRPVKDTLTRFVWVKTIDSAGCFTKSYLKDRTPRIRRGVVETLPVESQIEPIKIYPNPADGNVMVSWQYSSAADDAVVTLVDMTGKKLMVKSVKGGSTSPGRISINVASLPVGVYAVNVLIKNRTMITGKLLRK